MLGRIATIDADIARHRRADRGASGPFMWKTILDTRVLIAEDLGAAPTPLVLAQVECYTRRSAASRHPVAVARCGNQHVGGGCCASSRSIP